MEKRLGPAKDIKDLARRKEAAYRTVNAAGKIEENIEVYKLYDPLIIGRDIVETLGISDEHFAALPDDATAEHLLKQEIKRFSNPEKGSSKIFLKSELAIYLEQDIIKAFHLYRASYPEKGIDVAFIFCRSLVHVAIYQVIHDKYCFTGSDHGILHVHNNMAYSESMNAHMDVPDQMTPKQTLLCLVIHFIHDLGYSVGESDFNVKKDHPFISAKFIALYKNWFEAFLGEEETKLVHDCVLLHAIAAFDLDLTDTYSVLRWLTSNADACAVGALEKAQSFWRENPETLIPLVKLQIFLNIHPDTRQLLENGKALSAEGAVKLFQLKSYPENEEDPNTFLFEGNFVRKIEWKAWHFLCEAKEALRSVGTKHKLPHQEQEAFDKAIATTFNALSAAGVLSQVSIQEVAVTCEKNPDSAKPSDPKYIPAITMTPSELYKDLESLVSTRIVIQNILKLFRDEYAANEKDIRAAVDSIFQDQNMQVQVPSSVAALALQKPTHPAKVHHHRLTPLSYFTQHIQTAGRKLAERSLRTFPANLRAELQEIINRLTIDNPFEIIGELLAYRPLLPKKEDSSPRLHQKTEILANIREIQTNLSLKLDEGKSLTQEELSKLKKELRISLCLKSEEKYL